MKKLNILMAFLMLVACGSSGGGESSSSLFRLWKMASTDAPVDLSNWNFNTWETLTMIHTGGKVCECRSFIMGDTVSGTLTILDCRWAHECEEFEQAYNYSLSGSELTLCDTLNPNDCFTMH